LRVLFISANENLKSGLIQSQFIKPIEELSGNTDKEIIIINIYKPFGEKYSNNSIRVINLPVLIPFRFVNFTPLFFINELLIIFYAFLVSFYLKKNDILCTRAYVPGLIGFWVKKFKKISLIFDPRSLYVHENLDVNFKRDSICYKYWLYVEKRVVKSASKIISVSKGQNNYYRERYKLIETKGIVIPCYASSFDLIDSQKIKQLKSELGIEENEIVIGYIGSLNNGWNNIHLYKNYFSKCLDLNYKLFIISQDKEKLLSDPFFLNKGVYVFSFNEKINQYKITISSIQIADYGIVLLDRTHDWFSRLTVKFVDYTSNGLPVIVHKNVGEANNLIQTFSLAPSIMIDNFDGLKNLRKANENERIQIAQWSNQYFSKDNINKILF
jgi:hypothetical protein